MSSGFTVSGHGDLDAIFDAYQGGTKPAATGFRVGSQDLKDRFSPRAEGDDCGFDTGFQAGRTDLRQIFAAKGTSTKAKDPGFGSLYGVNSSQGTAAAASLHLRLEANGTWDIVQSGDMSTGSPTSGDWSKTVQSGIGSDYEARVMEGYTTSGLNHDPSLTYTYTHTGDTGWQKLDKTFHYDLGVGISGAHPSMSGPWTVGASGHVQLEIRKVGGSTSVSVTLHIDLSASLLMLT